MIGLRGDQEVRMAAAQVRGMLELMTTPVHHVPRVKEYLGTPIPNKMKA